MLGIVYENISDVSIGNDVWIGDNVTILPSVRVGNGVVIGTGAIVTKDVSSYTIMERGAAKQLKRRCTEDVAELLEEIKWWTWSDEELLAKKRFFHINMESPLAVQQLRGFI